MAVLFALWIINIVIILGAEVDAEGVRRVTIEGLQTDPCGGTHVRTTADLTGIQITRVRTKKGQLKLSYTAQHA